MPTPAEQAAEESVAGRQGVAEAPADPSLDDTNPIPTVQTADALQDPGTPQDSDPGSSTAPAPPAPDNEAAPKPEPQTQPQPEPQPEPESAPELELVPEIEPVPEPPAGSAAPAAPAAPVVPVVPVVPVAPAEPEPAAAPSSPQPNRAATTSLIAGILGVTAVGALLGLVFGGIGLARSRSVHTGKVRAWTGIVLSLLWVGAFVYVAPHVIKAADPGCTAFKEKVLPHYNQAIEDLDTRALSNKTTADLATAVAGLASAAAKSKNTQARNALRTLTRQLTTASNDQIAGQIPASVMVMLNQDAVAADNACGTI